MSLYFYNTIILMKFLAILLTLSSIIAFDEDQERRDFIDYDVNQDGFIDAAEIREKRPDID
jgi:hypothetical protein